MKVVRYTMIKDIKEFSAEEVGLWMAAQGLDPSNIISEGVDGDLLLSLAEDDFKVSRVHSRTLYHMMCFVSNINIRLLSLE